MSYGTIFKPADIKKRVIRGQDTKNQAAPLSVNVIDGEMWATNRYWVTRATRVAPLLEQFNLPVDEPGLYGVDGKVSRVANEVPDISKSVKSSLGEYTIPGTRVRIAGRDVYTVTDRGGILMDLYQLADGTHVGLLAEELAWLSNTADAPVPEGCHISGVHLMFRVAQTGGGCNVSAAVIGDVTRVVTPHKYGTDPETRELVNTPAVTEPAEPVLLAIVMATKYSSEA
jgi:hypothetical protein